MVADLGTVCEKTECTGLLGSPEIKDNMATLVEYAKSLGSVDYLENPRFDETAGVRRPSCLPVAAPKGRRKLGKPTAAGSDSSTKPTAADVDSSTATTTTTTTT